MKKLSLSLLFVCFSSTVWAIAGGTGVSDGGHGVVCGTGSDATVRLLDTVEAEAINGVPSAQLALPFQTVNGTFVERFEWVSIVIESRAIEALGADHPFVQSLREQMRRVIQVYPLGLMTPETFERTYDYGRIDSAIDPKCSIVQLAVRTEVAATTHLKTNLRYWSRLSEFDKYSLFVHEALHAWFSPEQSTKAVREANIYLFSSDAVRAANRSAFKSLVETKTAAF